MVKVIISGGILLGLFTALKGLVKLLITGGGTLGLKIGIRGFLWVLAAADGFLRLFKGAGEAKGATFIFD